MFHLLIYNKPANASIEAETSPLRATPRAFEIFIIKFHTPGTRLPIKCFTIYDGFVIKCPHPRDWNWKNALISRFFVLYKIELPCNDSLLFFILIRSTLFEKCFDLCHASSLWELWIVRSGISVLFKCPTLALSNVQMLDPRDTSGVKFPPPRAWKLVKCPWGCPGGCLSFDLIDA